MTERPLKGDVRCKDCDWKLNKWSYVGGISGKEDFISCDHPKGNRIISDYYHDMNVTWCPLREATQEDVK